MAMQTGSPDSQDEVLSVINTTPLVDVMLVLLIIFLITIPVVTLSVPVRLPKERNELRQSRPENIVVSVDAKGAIFWFDTEVRGTPALVERLKAVATRDPQPEVHIRGDLEADYESIGRVIQACQRAGIARVSFITEPPAKG